MIELGATSPTRDFLYVEDTARGIMRCAEVDTAVGEVINLGTGVEVSVGEIVDRVLQFTKREIPVLAAEDRLRPPESEVERLIADRSKAKALLGWEPAIDLDEGLRRTIQWMEAFLSVYKPEIYNV